MILENLKYFNKDFDLVEGSIFVNDKIISDANNASGEKYDFNGLIAIPGLIDIHTHGGLGADVCDKSIDSLNRLSKYYASHGVTSFCPTTMTLSHEELKEIFAIIENFKSKEPAAYIHGINMEGPYISKEKCGAQNSTYICKPNVEKFLQLNKISEISLVDVAPECDDNFTFGNSVKDLCVCSVAHTNASYECAKLAFKNGYSHVTHFYNAMTPFTHRKPGVVGAVFDSDKITVEMICDGLHLHEAAIRLAFKSFGENRCVTISDSLSGAGKSDGKFYLGKQEVFIKNGQARLADGTLAGSTSNLLDELKNLISFGIPFKSALKSCTINPAKVIGVDNICGSIDIGKFADIIFLDNTFKLQAVMIKGKFIK